MNHWERMRATLRGQEVDRPPISLWRHWPGDDETPQGLALAMLRWQHEYDFDLVKFMPTGTYGVEDWGATTAYAGSHSGTRVVTQFGVTAVEQWPRLAQLDVNKGRLGRELEALRLATAELGAGVPVVQTVFSPLTTARKLAGDSIFTHLRLHPDHFKEGLRIIAETTARFALACVRAGAHGLFFATQCSTHRLLDEQEHRDFGEVFDRLVLDAVRPEAELLMLHIHGEEIMFDRMAAYPVDLLNWHDRLTWPSLREAQQRFSGLMVGGVDEQHTLLNGPVEAIRSEIRDAMAQTGGRRLVIGPGCVMPTNTPAAHILAAMEAVRAGA